MLRSIVEPAFAKDPPLKLALSTTLVGGVVCVLGSLGVVGAILGLLRATLVVTGVGTWIVALLLLARAVGAGVAAYGGYRMYQYDSGWKTRIIYGLVLYFLTGILLLVSSPGSELFAIAVTAIAYYLMVVSDAPADTSEHPAAS